MASAIDDMPDPFCFRWLEPEFVKAGHSLRHSTLARTDPVAGRSRRRMSQDERLRRPLDPVRQRPASTSRAQRSRHVSRKLIFPGERSGVNSVQSVNGGSMSLTESSMGFARRGPREPGHPGDPADRRSVGREKRRVDDLRRRPRQHAVCAARSDQRRTISASSKWPGDSRPTASARDPSTSSSRRR